MKEVCTSHVICIDAQTGWAASPLTRCRGRAGSRSPTVSPSRLRRAATVARGHPAAGVRSVTRSSVGVPRGPQNGSRRRRGIPRARSPSGTSEPPAPVPGGPQACSATRRRPAAWPADKVPLAQAPLVVPRGRLPSPVLHRADPADSGRCQADRPAAGYGRAPQTGCRLHGHPAAQDLPLSWPTVMEALRTQARDVTQAPLPQVTVLGIDETRRGRPSWEQDAEARGA